MESGLAARVPPPTAPRPPRPLVKRPVPPASRKGQENVNLWKALVRNDNIARLKSPFKTKGLSRGTANLPPKTPRVNINSTPSRKVGLASAAPPPPPRAPASQIPVFDWDFPKAPSPEAPTPIAASETPGFDWEFPKASAPKIPAPARSAYPSMVSKAPVLKRPKLRTGDSTLGSPVAEPKRQRVDSMKALGEDAVLHPAEASDGIKALSLPVESLEEAETLVLPVASVSVDKDAKVRRSKRRCSISAAGALPGKRILPMQPVKETRTLLPTAPVVMQAPPTPPATNLQPPPSPTAPEKMTLASITEQVDLAIPPSDLSVKVAETEIAVTASSTGVALGFVEEVQDEATSHAARPRIETPQKQPARATSTPKRRSKRLSVGPGLFLSGPSLLRTGSPPMPRARTLSHKPVQDPHLRLALGVDKPKPKLKPKPAKLCVCRMGLGGEMVGCDYCGEWYHLACIGETTETVAAESEWVCLVCREIPASSSPTKEVTPTDVAASDTSLSTAPARAPDVIAPTLPTSSSLPTAPLIHADTTSTALVPPTAPLSTLAVSIDFTPSDSTIAIQPTNSSITPLALLASAELTPPITAENVLSIAAEITPPTASILPPAAAFTFHTFADDPTTVPSRKIRKPKKSPRKALASTDRPMLPKTGKGAVPMSAAMEASQRAAAAAAMGQRVSGRVRNGPRPHRNHDMGRSQLQPTVEMRKEPKKPDEEVFDWFVEVTSQLSLQPHSILKLAGIGVGTSTIGSKQVSFATVVRKRHFRRLQMGSCSVPQQGGFSLGLDWEVVHDTECVLVDGGAEGNGALQKRRHPCQKANFAEELPRLTEEERRALLAPEECGNECGHTETSGEHLHEVLDGGEGEDLEQLRTSRGSDFCNCGSLGLSCAENPDCFCTSNGIQCHVEGFGFCPCSRRGCGNPEGMYVFKFEAVRRARVAILGTKSSVNQGNKTPKRKGKKTRKERKQPAATRTPSRGHGGSTLHKPKVGGNPYEGKAETPLPGLLQIFLDETTASGLKPELAPAPAVEDMSEAFFDTNVLGSAQSPTSSALSSLFDANILGVMQTPEPKVLSSVSLFDDSIIGVPDILAQTPAPAPRILSSALLQRTPGVSEIVAQTPAPRAPLSALLQQTPVTCVPDHLAQTHAPRALSSALLQQTPVTFACSSGATPDPPTPPSYDTFSIL